MVIIDDPVLRNAPADVQDEIEFNDETVAAIAAAQGFVIENREHVEWFINKRYGYELEIKMIEQRAALEIETIQRRAEEQKKPFQREVDSLNFRFLRQAERVCRELIAGLTKGKTFTFARGAASTKKQPAKIEVTDKTRALEFAQIQKIEAAIRQKEAVTPPPELNLPAFKTWAKDRIEELRHATMVEASGEVELAQRLFDEAVKAELPFLELIPESQEFTLDIG